MGLLSKASSITHISKLAFSNFIISHNIKTFAVFELEDNYYSIINSIGFDGTSLLSSLSTKDFWQGLCEENNKIYTFESNNKSLNPMLQFFSFDLMEQIKNVSLYKTEDKIYMLCNKDFNENIISDLENVDYSIDSIQLDEINKAVTRNSKLVKFQIDFNEAALSFLSVKAKDNENKDKIKYVLINELINRFSCYFAKYSTKRISQNSINVIISVDNTIQNDHLICHIVYNLRKVLGITAELISFNNLGEANSIAEIKSFLQVD